MRDSTLKQSVLEDKIADGEIQSKAALFAVHTASSLINSIAREKNAKTVQQKTVQDTLKKDSKWRTAQKLLSARRVFSKPLSRRTDIEARVAAQWLSAKHLKFLTTLSPTVLPALCKSFVYQAARDGQEIVKQGDEGTVFYLIMEGRVAVRVRPKEHPTFWLDPIDDSPVVFDEEDSDVMYGMKKAVLDRRRSEQLYRDYGNVVAHLEEGAGFGELSLENSTSKRTATVIAAGDVALLVLPREAFRKVLTEQLNESKDLTGFFENHHLTKLFDKNRCKSLQYMVSKRQFIRKTVIMTEKQPINVVHFIASGTCVVSKQLVYTVPEKEQCKVTSTCQENYNKDTQRLADGKYQVNIPITLATIGVGEMIGVHVTNANAFKKPDGRSKPPCSAVTVTADTAVETFEVEFSEFIKLFNTHSLAALKHWNTIKTNHFATLIQKKMDVIALAMKLNKKKMTRDNLEKYLSMINSKFNKGNFQGAQTHLKNRRIGSDIIDNDGLSSGVTGAHALNKREGQAKKDQTQEEWEGKKTQEEVIQEHQKNSVIAAEHSREIEMASSFAEPKFVQKMQDNFAKLFEGGFILPFATRPLTPPSSARNLLKQMPPSVAAMFDKKPPELLQSTSNARNLPPNSLKTSRDLWNEAHPDDDLWEDEQQGTSQDSKKRQKRLLMTKNLAKIGAKHWAKLKDFVLHTSFQYDMPMNDVEKEMRNTWKKLGDNTKHAKSEKSWRNMRKEKSQHHPRYAGLAERETMMRKLRAFVKKHDTYHNVTSKAVMQTKDIQTEPIQHRLAIGVGGTDKVIEPKESWYHPLWEAPVNRRQAPEIDENEMSMAFLKRTGGSLSKDGVYLRAGLLGSKDGVKAPNFKLSPFYYAHEVGSPLAPWYADNLSVPSVDSFSQVARGMGVVPEKLKSELTAQELAFHNSEFVVIEGKPYSESNALSVVNKMLGLPDPADSPNEKQTELLLLPLQANKLTSRDLMDSDSDADDCDDDCGNDYGETGGKYIEAGETVGGVSGDTQHHSPHASTKRNTAADQSNFPGNNSTLNGRQEEVSLLLLLLLLSLPLMCHYSYNFTADTSATNTTSPSTTERFPTTQS